MAYGLLAALSVAAGVAFWAYLVMLRMPGKSYRGPLAALSAHETEVRDGIQRDVAKLAGTLGERNLRRAPKLASAADFVFGAFAAAGYAPKRQAFLVDGVGVDFKQSAENVEVELPGSDRAAEIVIVGAHYDSAVDAVGADDNASGVAGLLALARHFAGSHPSRTLRFVAFTNEEQPYAYTSTMGSVVYARRSRASGEAVVAMLSLESIGYFRDGEGTQAYPAPLSALFPSTGDFIGVVGDLKSRALVRQVVGAFRAGAQFPSEGAALPSALPGVGWSDHWAFWQVGYPAVMVTDTAPFRNPNYHTLEDTPDKLDDARCARVVVGLEAVVAQLAGL